MDRILRENENLAWFLGYKCGINHNLPIDDFRQACLVGLWQAVEKWHPSQGAFSYCVYWQVKKEIHERIRETANHRNLAGRIISLRDIGPAASSPDSDPAKEAEIRDEYKKVEKLIRRWHGQRALAMVRDRAYGFTLPKVGQRANPPCGHEGARQLLERVYADCRRLCASNI